MEATELRALLRRGTAELGPRLAALMWLQNCAPPGPLPPTGPHNPIDRMAKSEAALRLPDLR